MYKINDGKIDRFFAGSIVDLDGLILSYAYKSELWIVKKETIFDRFSNKPEEMLFVVNSLSEVVCSKHYKMLVSNIDKVKFGDLGHGLAIDFESYLSYYSMYGADNT